MRIQSQIHNITFQTVSIQWQRRPDISSLVPTSNHQWKGQAKYRFPTNISMKFLATKMAVATQACGQPAHERSNRRSSIITHPTERTARPIAWLESSDTSPRTALVVPMIPLNTPTKHLNCERITLKKCAGALKWWCTTQIDSSLPRRNSPIDVEGESET